ncbi:YagK/YfjJ domain-containing protein [Shewanella sp. 125m-7]
MSFLITKHNSLPYVYKNHCYPIIKPKIKGHFKRPLKKIFELCETMLDRYTKVFVVRFDLHPTEFSDSNKDIGLYLQTEKKKLQKEYKCKAAYFCTREQVSSPIQHYHVVFMLSGQKIQHPSRLLDLLEKSWTRFCGGKLAKVPHSYGTMVKGNKASIDPIVYRISYLTKEDSKELNGSARNFIWSRLKPKGNIDKHNDLLLVDPLATFLKNHKRHIFSKTNDLMGKIYKKPSQKHGWFSEEDLPISIYDLINSSIRTQIKTDTGFNGVT